VHKDLAAILAAERIETDLTELPKDIHFDLASLKVLDDSEDRNFWSRVRQDLVKILLHRHAPLAGSLLDIGCGNGSLITRLEREVNGLTVAGMDGYPQALLNCRRRSSTIRLILHDLAAPDWPASVRGFGAATIMDVLEHLDHPETVLRHAHSALKNGGTVIVSVPAGMSLWSRRDVFLGHRRRYDRRSLTSLLRDTGFDVVTCNYLFGYLWLPAWLNRKVLAGLLDDSGRATEARELRTIPVINTILTLIGMAEVRLGKYLPLPCGTSVYCVARKR
jgi:SAM-dependent methyltransferase